MAQIKRVARAAALTAAGAAFGAAVERMLLAAPSYHGPITTHYDGTHFQNAEPIVHGQGSVLKWQLTKQQGWWPDWIDAPHGPAPPERVGDARLRVTFINHATVLIQMDGLNILTDPIWSDRTSPVRFAGPKRHRPPGIRFDDLPPIDVVLVSHNHYDHLDIPTLLRLQARHRMTILTPLGNSLLMARHGIERAHELDWWQAREVSERARVTLVPAKHFSARGLSDRNRNLWGGFVVSTPGGHVYFAGDTGWGSHFAEIGARFAPIRLAILPIGAYLPRWFMSPVHVDPAEAVRAHVALGARVSMPMHFGTFRLSDEGIYDPLRDLRIAIAATPGAEFLILDEGEGRDVA